jgi:general secretion pathway protein D
MARRGGGWAARLCVIVAVALALPACSARWAYRQGQAQARQGNWDLAVARFTKALQDDPDNIGYKIALENARIQASRQHYELGRRHLLAEELDKAAEELEIAANYDPANKSAADDLAIVRGQIAAREAEKRRMEEFGTAKAQAQAQPLPIPVLSARSTAPITLRWENQSFQKLLETLGKLAGINVLFDEAFRDRTVSVDLRQETFQDALDRITFVNRHFYKVLDPNTIIVVPESTAKRRAYDDVLLRNFYLENAEVKDLEAILKAALGSGPRALVSNANLNSITLLGTPDEIAVAERIIDLNDKSRGEVLVEVEILEINRNQAKRYGLELSNYELQGTFSPTGAAGELAGGFANVRAHVLSSLNLSDFVLSVPAGIFARFLRTDSTTRILANPRLRAAEGKKTTLQIGQEVPIPVTTFTATQAGSTTFAPATSFQYRNVGVTLDVTPRVNPNGDISMEMVAEFSLIGADRNVGTGDNPLNVPTFLTRKVTGTLRLRDGETTLLGGLIQKQEGDTLRGALGASKVPIIGKLLSGTNKTNDDLEILMSITPHLVRAPKVTAGDLTTLAIGTRELIRVPSVRPPLFGTVEDPATAPSPAPGAPPGAPVAPVTPPEGPAVAPPPPSGTIESPPPPAGPAVPAPAEPRRVSAQLSPSELRVAPGATTSVGVVAMGVQDLTSVDLVVTWDPRLLEATEVAPGALLTLDGQPVGVERGLESGRLRARFTRTAGTAGSGVVAVMTFRALGSGTGRIAIEQLTLAMAGVPTPVPTVAGTVTVTP